MSHKDIYNAISPIVPCAHVAWGVSDAPELPRSIYYINDPEAFCADDDNYVVVNHWCVELYERVRDANLEDSISEKIREVFGPVTVFEEWVPAEKCRKVSFYFTQIER